MADWHVQEQWPTETLSKRLGISEEKINDIGDAAHREELLRRLPRSKSIPQIFIDGAHIGGFEYLEILAGDCRLEDMARG